MTKGEKVTEFDLDHEIETRNKLKEEQKKQDDKIKKLLENNYNIEEILEQRHNLVNNLKAVQDKLRDFDTKYKLVLTLSRKARGESSGKTKYGIKDIDKAAQTFVFFHVDLGELDADYQGRDWQRRLGEKIKDQWGLEEKVVKSMRYKASNLLVEAGVTCSVAKPRS